MAVNKQEYAGKARLDLQSSSYQSTEDVGANPAFIPISHREPQRADQKKVAFNGLLTNKILGSLPGSDFARLLPYLEPVSLEPSQRLKEAGERMEFVYFPETAVISQVYFLRDGGKAAASIVGNDGLIGLSSIFDCGGPPYCLQVTLGGSALRTSVKVIQKEFSLNDAMRQLLLSYTTARLAQLSRRAVCNGLHQLLERLCTWLLMIQDRAGNVDLPLTHEVIANNLGARRAGITISCRELRDSGIIKYRRGLICIVDREKLQARACECYSPPSQLR